jgi:DNA invertase Pin-like site-specific DNA recombinase
VKDMTKRVALLARQSLTRRDSTSIATQVETLTTYWQEEGARIVATLTAENTRGWKEKRDDLDAIMALGDRREIDVVSFWSLDRLARTVRQQENAIYELNKRKVTIHSYREPWASDASPEMRQIAAVFNERFTRDLSARLKGVAQNHFRAGILHSTAPYGYRKANRETLIVPEHAAVVQWIFERYRDGAGSSRIAEELTEKGIPTPANGKGWRADVILRILRNPVYVGIQKANGAMLPGNWEHIIDQRVWDEVQHLLHHGRQPSTSYEGRSWLQGLAHHGCGNRLYMHGGNHRQRPDGSSYVWFYFSCSRAYLTVDRCDLRPIAISRVKFENAIKAQFLADIAARTSWKAAHDAALARHDDRHATKRLAALERRRERVLVEQDRVRSWFIKGRLSEQDAETEDDRIRDELSDIDNEIAALSLPPSATGYQSASDALALLQSRLTGEIPPSTLRQAIITIRARPILSEEGPTIRYPTVIADLLGCPERAF